MSEVKAMPEWTLIVVGNLPAGITITAQAANLRSGRVVMSGT